MEKILVVGAHGTTGKKIVDILKNSNNYSPVAMLRKEEQVAQFKENGVDTVLADLEKDVSHAVKGVDKIIFAAGSGGGTSKEKTTAVDQEGAKKVIDAAKNSGIKKFVMLSSMGADAPQQNEEMQHYLEAKHNADHHLKNSGISYTIVRPGALNDKEGTGKIELQHSLNKKGEINRHDVAETLVAALKDGSAKNSTFEILQGDTQITNAIHAV